MKRVLITYFLAHLLISCSETSSVDSCELVFKEKISFDLDEKMYYFSKAIFPYKDESTGKEYLTLGNTEKGQHEIIIFDLETGDLKNRIEVKREGPDAIFMLGHYPIDLETFYVTSAGRQMIYKIDQAGKILESYDYSQSTDQQFVTLSFSMSIIYRPLVVKDSCFYIPQGMIKGTMGPEDWGKTPMGAKIDMRTGITEKTDLMYPVMYSKQQNCASGIDTDCNLIYNGENFIYHFAKKNNVIMTQDNKNVQTYEIKSRYADNIKIGYNSSSSILEIERKNISEAMYWHLIYDEYRELYYRFVFFPCEFGKNDDVMLLSNTRQEFSIITANKKFEVIGETRFPKNTYMPKMVFVGEKGLYISENNPYNEDFDEDKLVFSCFVPEYKK